MWRKKHALLWHFYNARKNKRFRARFQLNSTKCEEKFTHMTSSPTFAVLHSMKKVENLVYPPRTFRILEIYSYNKYDYVLHA